MASQPAEVQIEEQPSTIVPATETPYRDDPDAEGDAGVSPLVHDEEQHVPPTEPPYRDGNNTDEPHQHGPTEPPARRPSDEEQPATTEENPNPDSPRRQFNFIMFHQITLGLAISIFLHFLARVLILHFARIPGYRGIHSVDQTIYGALLGSVFTCIWSSFALLHRRHSGRLPSFGLGAVVHGLIGPWSTLAGLSGISEITVLRSCSWNLNQGDWQICKHFAERFNIFLYSYQAFLFVFGLTHTILFVACLTAVYRSWRWPQDGLGLLLPAGDVSLEFTVRFRRNGPPSARPVQPGTEAVQEDADNLI